jgi:DNA mismatch repair protein MutS
MKRESSYFERGSAGFSLLYSPGTSLGEEEVLELSPAQRAAHDLGLDELIAAFTPDRGHQNEIRKLWSRVPRNPEVIRYRQDVLDDLLANPDLAEGLASLMPAIDSLSRYSGASGYHAKQEMPWLHEVVERVGELQSIIDCYEGMGEVLRSAGGRLHSQGLRSLQDEVRKAQDDPKYQSLVQELPGLLSKLRSRASITIGINLDASLRPVGATLLSVNEKPFTEQSLLNRLFGARNDRQGIAPLHTVPPTGPFAGPVDPLMVPLFTDLAKVLEKTAIPIADQLRGYAGLHGRLFTDLRRGLVFYLGAVRFIGRLQSLGLDLCRPEIVPADERRCEVKDSYNVHLALRALTKGDEAAQAIVRNDIRLGPDGRILILTGPNHGGKTTFMQGAGVVHILAQLGLYVPGTQAIISPLDGLFTHFPIEEQPELDTGRFGEEAIRLGKIFEQVTRHSLVLLNESLSSTSSGESLYLAQDVVRLLRRVGARAIYATHLHELASRAGELNDSVHGDSTILSVVSSPVDTGMRANGEVVHTYRLEVRPPLGQSYAREIAARYGISYEQLEKILEGRGILGGRGKGNRE